MAGANSYKIYASDDPYAVDWGTAIATGITGTSWSEALPGTNKFYYVTADNTTPAVMLNKGNRRVRKR
ncbi:MAG: hypothetical protein KAW88_08095 [Candidatus Cloacimonetes bacterium]|nr:hypothetical protein [Candidatus Cloacimonadota bacterium]